MNSLRYKLLLSYLPGMASVVNAFESPQVQNTVFETLMEALEAKLKAEGIGASAAMGLPRDSQRLSGTSTSLNPTGEVTHDLIEGESIHGDSGRGNMTTSTVF